MNKALLAIALADDVSVIRATEYLHETLSRALANSGITQAELIGLAKENEEVAAFLEFANRRAGEVVGENHSVAAARQLLVIAALDPSLERMVAQCVENWPDDRQSVGIMITVGAIAGLLLLIATLEIEYTGEHTRIHKKSMIPNQAHFNASILSMKVELGFSGAQTAKPAEPSAQQKASNDPNKASK
jgi:hypothetical protein